MQVVTAHVWRLRARHAGFGAAAAAVPARRLAARLGARFARVLGTAGGQRMTIAAAQPATWAVIACWDDEASARRFEDGAYVERWARRSVEAARLLLTPSASRGRWGGAVPFDAPAHAGARTRSAGAVAAITRARIRVPALRRFWLAVPPVAAQLNQAPGRRAALGIGEAPLLWQGTLSVWDDDESLSAFAYSPGAHADALRAPPAGGWFAEQLFARFGVLEAAGSIGGAVLSQPSRPGAPAARDEQGRAA